MLKPAINVFKLLTFDFSNLQNFSKKFILSFSNFQPFFKTLFKFTHFQDQKREKIKQNVFQSITNVVYVNLLNIPTLLSNYSKFLSNFLKNVSKFFTKGAQNIPIISKICFKFSKNVPQTPCKILWKRFSKFCRNYRRIFSNIHWNIPKPFLKHSKISLVFLSNYFYSIIYSRAPIELPKFLLKLPKISLNYS